VPAWSTPTGWTGSLGSFWDYVSPPRTTSACLPLNSCLGNLCESLENSSPPSPNIGQAASSSLGTTTPHIISSRYPPLGMGPRSSYVPTELRRAQFVFVRRDAHRMPLQMPYTGPFRVLEAGDKSFLLAVAGRQDRVSIDRLKPAHLDPVPVQQESRVMRQESFLIPVVPSAVPTLLQPPCTTPPPAPPPPFSPVPMDRLSSSAVHSSPITPPTPAGYRTRSGRLVIPPRTLTYHVHVDSGGAYVAEPLGGDKSFPPNHSEPI